MASTVTGIIMPITGSGGALGNVISASVQEILQWLHNYKGGQKDHSAIAQYYEYLTGIKISR